MSEDWRLTARVKPEPRWDLLARLREYEVEDDARKRLGGAVAVSADGDNVYVYADSREAVHESERVIRSLLEERGSDADFAVQRWHELEQRWEDEAIPLPATQAERRAEHQRLIADEEAESRRAGRALWEVRLVLPSHAETRELARRLEDDGVMVVRRWNYLLVGADSEDEARELATRLREEVPSGVFVQTEASEEMAAEVAPANPFAVFGGLGS